MNEVLLLGALVAFAAAVLTTLLIRQRDFVDVHGPEAGGAPATAQEPATRETVAAG
jgi:hypothetical protein